MPVRYAFFCQRYKQGDADVVCRWGISGDAMSFLVIDATNGLHTDASFKLATDDIDSHGILECGICMQAEPVRTKKKLTVEGRVDSPTSP